MLKKKKKNITKMEKPDINQTNVTGVYLLEIDSLFSWEKNSSKTTRGIPWTNYLPRR